MKTSALDRINAHQIFCRVIRYHTDKLAWGTETTQNHTGMQSLKCHSCKLWSKEAEKITERSTHSHTWDRKQFIKQSCGRWRRTEGFMNTNPAGSCHLRSFALASTCRSTAFSGQCFNRQSWRLPHWTVPSTQFYGR
ncbi:hypothetical protein TNCV_678541 [Trichonephila clavipes]|nr:hypothetical protein TNCV_678541 [Trichonephila clavipes]